MHNARSHIQHGSRGKLHELPAQEPRFTLAAELPARPRPRPRMAISKGEISLALAQIADATPPGTRGASGAWRGGHEGPQNVKLVELRMYNY